MKLAALLTLFVLAAAAAPPPELSEAQRARARKLESSLIAPCCWAKTVAEETSAIALSMRAEIARMVSQGMSDRDILDYYKRQYGTRILGEPEGAAWWWSQVVPLVVTLAGLAAVVLLLRKWRLRAA